MAHELTHIANRDVMVMTLASFFATIAAYIVQFGFLFGGTSTDDDDGPSAMVLVLVSLVVYFVSFLLMQALSRYREFAADRGAALITGRPSALASALVKISGGMARIPKQDLRAASELNAFFIFPTSVGGLFATHPPMEKRIAALERLESQLQGQRRLACSAMGFLDILRGKRELKMPAADRLFAMSTAYVKLELELEMKTTGQAAIVFQPLATADFEGIVRDMEEVVKGTGEETGTTVTSTDDEFGYRWMILNDPDMEDLVVGVNAVSTAIQGGGYGDRVLCAVFAFRDNQGKPVYFIYNYKRGGFYPFVPAPGAQQQDQERALRLKAQIGADLPIEPELERWFPLWGIPI